MHSLHIVLWSHPVFALPNFTKPFQIEIDASDTGISSVFTQEHASVYKPIA